MYSRMDQVRFVEGQGEVWSASLQVFLRLSSTDFTWSVLEYFVPHSIDFGLFAKGSSPNFISNIKRISAN